MVAHGARDVVLAATHLSEGQLILPLPVVPHDVANSWKGPGLSRCDCVVFGFWMLIHSIRHRTRVMRLLT